MPASSELQINIPPICPPCPTCSKEMRLVVTRDQGRFSSRAILVFGETVRKAAHKLRYWQLLPPNSCHLSY